MTQSIAPARTFAVKTLAVSVFLSLAACAPESAPPPQATAPAPVEMPAAETPAPAPKPEPPNPERLAGLNPKEVQALVGEPTLVRRENTVQVMLFEKPSCVLEVVFYEDHPGDYFRAKNISARTRQGTPVDASACLTDILPGGQWREERN
ncbi:hypothetical protein [Kordiimonas marina]|uniref:hypothetical protein n=1 Tax=Kordiimonas marina TaxID=2872312 RepID=UPI001FF64297|nr:hypothetical protein [Kordiimonas marina]MCJ9429789.1 hypothetical protein [Kordiimonas marina]